MNRNRILRATLPCLVMLTVTAMSAHATAQQLVAPSILPGSINRLTPFEPAFGSLTAESGQNFKDGSRLQLWSFTGNSNEVISIRVGSDDFDTFLTLIGPDGQVIDWNDDDWGNPGQYWYSSMIETVLPESGRHIAVVSGYSSHDFGNYEILLAAGGPLPSGRDLSTAMALEAPGSATGLIEAGMPAVGEGFYGPGEVWSFSLDDRYLTVISARSSEIDTVIVLYDSDGALIDLNDDDYSALHMSEDEANWTDSSLTLFLEPGTYYLVVGSYSDWEPFGTYEVTLSTYIEAP